MFSNVSMYNTVNRMYSGTAAPLEMLTFDRLIELICKLHRTEQGSNSYNVLRLERWSKYENLIANEREEKMVR